MAKISPPPLPDIEDTDAEFRARLAPLAERVLPHGADYLPPSLPSRPSPKLPSKPPRKGIEFLLPEPVVTSLKTKALQRGVTATVLLMELLQREGYPVTEADFTDLRKVRR